MTEEIRLTIKDEVIKMLSKYLDVSTLPQSFWDEYFVYQNKIIKLDGERIFGVLKTYIDPLTYEKIDTVIKSEFKEYSTILTDKVDKLIYKPR